MVNDGWRANRGTSHKAGKCPTMGTRSLVVKNHEVEDIPFYYFRSAPCIWVCRYNNYPHPLPQLEAKRQVGILGEFPETKAQLAQI